MRPDVGAPGWGAGRGRVMGKTGGEPATASVAGEPCHCATALHLPCPTCQRWAAIFTRLTLRRVSRGGTR